MSFCTHCGQKAEAEIRFCTGCGVPIAISTPTPATVVPPTAADASRHAAPSQAAPSQAAPSQPGKTTDLRLKVIAGVSCLVSLTGFIAGLAHLLPSSVSTLIVLLGVSVGLRVVWSFAARSASSAGRARAMQMTSNVGLGISLASIAIGLPRITHGAGIQTFIVDVLAQLWTMAILTLAASHVRTFNWRVLVGAMLTGFLGLTALARFVGRPLVENLGPSSVFAIAVFVPITEEFFKLIPVLIVLAVSLRHKHLRPSAMDVTMLGAWTGAGFAIYENATLGRGHFSLDLVPVVSLLFPSSGVGRAFGWPMMQTGHLCHTALIALALGFALLYCKRSSPIRWFLPLIAISVVLLEHMSQNALAIHGVDEPVAELTILLTLGGWLSSLLLIAGASFVILFEWRILGRRFSSTALRRLPTAEMIRRSSRFAQAQNGSGA